MNFANKCVHTDRRHVGRGLCSSCYNKEWNSENPQKVRDKGTRYRRKNLSHMAEKERQRRLKHKELGLCRQCSEMALPGKTRCYKHTESHAMDARYRNYQYTPGDELRFKTIENCDWCDLSFNGETPHQDHDHACCLIGGRSCGRCLRGLVHKLCNDHAIMWFEWYEKNTGVCLPLLKSYRDKFPRREF
jgi:hypothetical protein